ncbi:MAG: sigma-70 family RNA polymerase sigma factor [Dermatophilaceae bacterium]
MSASVGALGRAWTLADDAALLAGAREGDSDAYAELWRRHLTTAYAVAHRYRGRASAEDVVAEASLRVYGLLRAGKGPTTNFRSYFLSAVKTVAVDLARGDLRVVPSETEDLESAAEQVKAYDVEARVDQDLVRTAFSRLPERDEQVLWHTTVEGRSPAAVATTMGLTPNGVSVVALRARDALRARYLEAHADRAISRARDEECRWVLAQMGRYVRGKLPVRQRARVEEHLAGCARARALALELTEVNRGLKAVMVPLIFVAGTSTGAAWIGGLAGAGAGGDAGQRPDPSAPTGALLAGLRNLASLGGKVAGVAVAAALGAGFVGAPAGGFAALSGAGGATPVVAGGGGGGGGGAGGASSSGAGAGGGSGGSASALPQPVPPAPTPSGPSLDALTALGAAPARTTPTRTATATRPTTTASAAPSPSPSTPVPTPPPGTSVPVPAAGNPTSAAAGQPLTLTFDFGSSAGGTITVAVSSGPPGTTCSPSGTCTFPGPTGSVTFTPQPTAYPATVTITVTNSAGQVTTTTLTIAPPPDVPPTFPTNNPTSAIGGQPITLTVNTGSVFGGTVTAAFVAGTSTSTVPLSGCGSPCTIAGTSGTVTLTPPTDAPGTIEVTIVNAAGLSQVLSIPVLIQPSFVTPLPPLPAGVATAVSVDTGALAGGTVTVAISGPGTVSVALVTAAPAGVRRAAVSAVVPCSPDAATVICALPGQFGDLQITPHPLDPKTTVTVAVSNSAALETTARTTVVVPKPVLLPVEAFRNDVSQTVGYDLGMDGPGTLTVRISEVGDIVVPGPGMSCTSTDQWQSMSCALTETTGQLSVAVRFQRPNANVTLVLRNAGREVATDVVNVRGSKPVG